MSRPSARSRSGSQSWRGDREEVVSGVRGRRSEREILRKTWVGVRGCVSGVEELDGGDPTVRGARERPLKARAVARDGNLVIGCDTDVVIDGKALGKPAERSRRGSYLIGCRPRPRGAQRAGAARRRGGAQRARTRPRSSSGELRDAEKERYVASGEWRERAGGYAIQRLGSTLVERSRATSPT